MRSFIFRLISSLFSNIASFFSRHSGSQKPVESFTPEEEKPIQDESAIKKLIDKKYKARLKTLLEQESLSDSEREELAQIASRFPGNIIIFDDSQFVKR